MDSPCLGTRREEVPAFFQKRSPHRNIGSQYGCDFQCGQHAIRINGTHPRVRIPLCGWCGCTYFCVNLQPHHPILEPRLRLGSHLCSLCLIRFCSVFCGAFL
ncbi:unnamed protein product, partial [Staurois parvus]